MRRTDDDFYRVKALVGLGLSDYKIAERTGVDRSTVLRWRKREHPPYAHLPSADAEWNVPDPDAYSYLLGCYLGDGHVTHKPPGGWVLRIACDRRYAEIISGFDDRWR
jgi:transcriptional regulator with XRE-family HTH domain